MLAGVAWEANSPIDLCAATASGDQLSDGRRNHWEWMVRSFALTYAAVPLRIYLTVLAALSLSFLTSGYRASRLCAGRQISSSPSSSFAGRGPHRSPQSRLHQRRTRELTRRLECNIRR